jgi:lipopolysaccharide biosynthesis glycosyltransferase
MMREPIVFAFCISDSYSQHAAVVVTSILKSNPNETFEFHILASGLSQENKHHLKALTSPKSAIIFHEIDRSAFKDYPIHDTLFSLEIYYRFIIHKVVDRPRVIYSDVDVIVQGSLRPLWETDLKGLPMGAVKEVNELRGHPRWPSYKARIGMDSSATFFYSGLLLLDCERLREMRADERFMQDAAWCSQHFSPDLFAASDQVVINRVLQHQIFELSPAYCVTDCYLKKQYYGGEIIIRHYAGAYEKPWCYKAWTLSWYPYYRALKASPYKANARAFFWRHIWANIWTKIDKKGIRKTTLFGIRIKKQPFVK